MEFNDKAIWKAVKIKGFFVEKSKSGASLKCKVTNIDEMAESIKTVLTRRPVWKTQYDDREREFIITFKGAVLQRVDGEEILPDTTPDLEDEI